MKLLPRFASLLAVPVLLAFAPFSTLTAAAAPTHTYDLSRTLDGSCTLTVTWSWQGYEGGNDTANITVTEDGNTALSQEYSHVSGKSGTHTLTKQFAPSSLTHTFSVSGTLLGGGGKVLAYYGDLSSQGSCQ